ncbi:MAG: DUF3299 domain-containing protein [Planctomycetota bacterium]|nr:DUF3299 domain-containing protein [Planctomycetota bacterium]
MKSSVALLPLLLVAACGDEPASVPDAAPRGKPIAESNVAREPEPTAAPAPQVPDETALQAMKAPQVELAPAERLARDGFEALRMTDEERAAIAQVLKDNGRTQLPASAFPARVRELDGATAAIRGWMIPGRIEKRDVRDFMLVRDNQACCFGAMPTFDEWIHVEMEPDAHAEYLRYVEMEVTGTLQVGGLPVAEGVQPPALRMRATRCRPVKEPRVR